MPKYTEFALTSVLLCICIKSAVIFMLKFTLPQ